MAANYDQPSFVEKRVRFFDGQYLQDQDFIDEQKYHVDRQRRHNRTLHIAGIADGLAVSKVDGNSAQVTVAAGTAIDSGGRQLLVASAQTVERPPKLTNTTVNLYLVYKEQPVDQQTQGGIKDSSRWLEQPEFLTVPQGASVQHNYPPVLLAELVLDGSGNIASVNSNVRQYSGLRLPGPTADGPTLRADANGVAQLAGSLSVTGNVGIGTSDPGTNKLKVTGNTYLEGTLTVNGNTSTSGSLSFGSQVRQMINLYSTTYGIGVQSNTQYFRTDKNFAWYKKGAHSGDELTAGGTDGTVQMVIKDGNVGIGTADPGANKLKVTGNTYLEGTLTVNGNTSTSGSLSFGSQVRQMINLWSTDFGIGVQGHTQYFRTSKNFAWYKNGAHDDRELAAGTNGTVQMVIKDGNVGIGTPTPEAKLEIAGGGGTNIDFKVNGRLQSNNNDGGLWVTLDRFVGGYETDKIGVWNGNAWRFAVRSDGDVEVFNNLFVHGKLNYWWNPDSAWKNIQNKENNFAGSYRTDGPSDIRFKTALRPIRNALEKVLQLNGKCYRWGEAGLKHFTRHISETYAAGPDATEDENRKLWDTERHKAYQVLSGDKLGLIAQELEAVVPEAVHEDEEGYKYIQYQQLTALLIEAIKEQSALIQSLSGKVAALEGR